MMRLIAVLAFSALVSAHSKVTHFHVNGQATTSCVRAASGSGGGTGPINDLSSKDLACNVVKSNPKEKCSVKAGDEVAFEYRSQPDQPPARVKNDEGENVGVTDVSHKGPCAIYAKKVDDAAAAEGAGSGWFKIWEDAVDGSGQFCTTRLNDANSAMTAKIPTSLKNGDYILRSEMLTLNNADPKGEREPQFYPGCVQITVTGGAETADTSSIEVSIPGHLTLDTPGVLYNIWAKSSYSDYKIGGPKVLDSSNAGSGSGSTPQSTSRALAATTLPSPSKGVDPPLGNPPSAPAPVPPVTRPTTDQPTAAPEVSAPAPAPAPTKAPSEGEEGVGGESGGDGEENSPSGVAPPVFVTAPTGVSPTSYLATGTGPSTLLTVRPTTSGCPGRKWRYPQYHGQKWRDDYWRRYKKVHGSYDGPRE